MKITLNGVEVSYTSYEYEPQEGMFLWTAQITKIAGVKLNGHDDMGHNFSEDYNGADLTAYSKKDLYSYIRKLNKENNLFINKNAGY
jgi:hypothetical protein